MIRKLVAYLLIFALTGCAGQYQGLSVKMADCGYPNSQYTRFHDCMKDKVSVPKTNDTNDYYAKTSREFIDQMDHYQSLVDHKKMSSKSAMTALGNYVQVQSDKEKKAAQEAAAFSAILVAGAVVASCSQHNSCGGGGGYSQPDHRGCCSWHRGITNMCAPNGHILCQDGTPSPTCGC